MPMLTPDPTFYPSPTMATKAPPERLAYLALINPTGTGRPDAIGVNVQRPAQQCRAVGIGELILEPAFGENGGDPVGIAR